MPDFVALVRFLIQPLLDSPDALSVHCETLAGGKRLWIRVAFEGDDKGRVFGRGGRNIQAIRRIVAATAKLSGCDAHLDVYGEPAQDGEGGKERSRPRSRDGGRNGGRSGGRNGGRSGPSRGRRRPSASAE